MIIIVLLIIVIIKIATKNRKTKKIIKFKSVIKLIIKIKISQKFPKKNRSISLNSTNKISPYKWLFLTSLFKANQAIKILAI